LIFAPIPFSVRQPPPSCISESQSPGSLANHSPRRFILNLVPRLSLNRRPSSTISHDPMQFRPHYLPILRHAYSSIIAPRQSSPHLTVETLAYRQRAMSGCTTRTWRGMATRSNARHHSSSRRRNRRRISDVRVLSISALLIFEPQTVRVSC
jgi:hypothetical protein